ncbi:MAG: HI1506-related protein [Pseudomonadota bacterium]
MAEALAKYPLFFAASEAWKAAHPGTLPTLIRIASKVEGFRRAGMAHSKAPADHSIFDFDPDRIEMLLGEPNLKVEFV